MSHYNTPPPSQYYSPRRSPSPGEDPNNRFSRNYSGDEYRYSPRHGSDQFPTNYRYSTRSDSLRAPVNHACTGTSQGQGTLPASVLYQQPTGFENSDPNYSGRGSPYSPRHGPLPVLSTDRYHTRSDPRRASVDHAWTGTSQGPGTLPGSVSYQQTNGFVNSQYAYGHGTRRPSVPGTTSDHLFRAEMEDLRRLSLNGPPPPYFPPQRFYESQSGGPISPSYHCNRAPPAMDGVPSPYSRYLCTDPNCGNPACHTRPESYEGRRPSQPAGHGDESSGPHLSVASADRTRSASGRTYVAPGPAEMPREPLGRVKEMTIDTDRDLMKIIHNKNLTNGREFTTDIDLLTLDKRVFEDKQSFAETVKDLVMRDMLEFKHLVHDEEVVRLSVDIAKEFRENWAKKYEPHLEKYRENKRAGEGTGNSKQAT